MHIHHPEQATTPEELLQFLNRLDPDLPARIGEAYGKPPPPDAHQDAVSRSWQCALVLRHKNPSLPSLPSPAPKFVDRLLQLVNWCLDASGYAVIPSGSAKVPPEPSPAADDRDGRWDPTPGADPNETMVQRHDRILRQLLDALDADTEHGMGMVPWRSIVGARRSDLSYLLGKKFIEAGFSVPPGQHHHAFGNPEFMSVWLTTAGADAAMELPPEAAPESAPAALAAPTVPPEVNQHVFAIEGAVWRIRFGSEIGSFPKQAGFAYLARLLREPHAAVPALKMAMERQPGPGRSQRSVAPAEVMSDPEQDSATVIGKGTADLRFDDRALSELREEVAAVELNIQEIRAEIDSANGIGDEPAAERLHREELVPELEKLNALRKRMAGDTALGGRSRPNMATDPDRARQAVGAAIRRAIKQVEKSMPKCAAHLKGAIPEAQGGDFIYRPEVVPSWNLK